MLLHPPRGTDRVLPTNQAAPRAAACSTSLGTCQSAALTARDRARPARPTTRDSVARRDGGAVDPLETHARRERLGRRARSGVHFTVGRSAAGDRAAPDRAHGAGVMPCATDLVRARSIAYAARPRS